MKIFLPALLMIISFQANSQTVEPYISSLSKARADVEANIDQKPYKKEQQQVFKNYFIEIGELVNDVNGSDRFYKRFQNYNSSNGVSSLCKSIILGKDSWSNLVANCTKNRFFLCAEEIKAFDLYKESLKRLLTKEQQDEFAKLPECE